MLLLGALSMGSTPGDIGGCGQAPEPLDPTLFYRSLEATDCRQCQACGFSTATCVASCERASPGKFFFPEECAPLAHDGEVCLRRLLSEDCETYRPSVLDREDGSTTPIEARPRPQECQFCPAR